VVHLNVELGIFEIVISTGILISSVPLVRNEGRGPWIRAGLLLGIASFFGRNFALYGAVSFVLLWIYRRTIRRDAAWGRLADLAASSTVGLLPIAFLALTKPGFGAAWIDSFRIVLSKGFMLPLPFPWPWMSDRVAVLASGGAAGFSLLFLLLALSFSGRRLPPEALAAAFVGLPLLHYAFSRTDVVHLSVVLLPFWFGGFALLSGSRWQKSALGGALLFSLWTILPASGISSYLFHRDHWSVQARLQGQVVRLDPFTGRWMAAVGRELQELPPGDNVAFLPCLPGLYPAFNLPSPIWDLYNGFYLSEEEQNRTLQELEDHRVNRILFADWSFVGDRPSDYETAHPKIFRYLQTHYLVHRVPNLDASYLWLIRMDPARPNDRTP
jgi:hypothetical protein